MGITGLLPFLEKASSACNLRELRGKCVAIDSYCWLHRGAFGCAERLARGEQTDAHIQYCLKYVQLLLRYNIKPILVFDGRHLPAKAATEAKRRESRENARKRGAELLRLGRIDEARNYLRRCVDITHEMALRLIQECRNRNVDCIVAPYEADAQLAFLNRSDIAQYVITEDSDLVLFGCNRILFKLDLTGNGRLVEADKLHLAMGCREDRFEFAKFRYMCILSGCDYLDSLPGIGLAKACRFVLKTDDPDVRKALAKLPSYLNMRQLTVPEEYKDEFLKADATFKHMVVYDPVHRRQTRLLDPDEEGTLVEHCCNAGEFLDEPTAFKLALGNLDPFTLQTMDDWHPDGVDVVDGGQQRHPSIWRQNYSALLAAKQQKATESQSASQRKTTFVKRPPTNADFVAQGTQDSISDVLQAYGIRESIQAPPLKRLCHTQTVHSSTSAIAIEYEDVNALETMALLDQPTTPKQNRNPFLIATTGPISSRDAPDALLSPTKITPENRSLLLNVSPVKRIDYSQQRQPAVSNTTTTGRLSRFKRTISSAGATSGGTAGQKVISRFFCSQQTTTTTITTSQIITNIASTTAARKGAESNNSPTGTVLPYESPTAIVREGKSKRKILEATALYLQSPEALSTNRGERTPEKRASQCFASPVYPAPLDRLDSGIAMEQELDQKKDITISGGTDDGTGGEALSSSQKENEETNGPVPVRKELSGSPPSRASVRLALFEHQRGKTLNPDEDDDSEQLAIVLDDDEDEAGAGGQPARTHMAMIKEEQMQREELQRSESATISRSKAAASATRKPGAVVEKKGAKSAPSCRRPGLSGARKQASSAEKSGGLTQSRLSMFGFQKKPSMQLADGQ